MNNKQLEELFPIIYNYTPLNSHIFIKKNKIVRSKDLIFNKKISFNEI